MSARYAVALDGSGDFTSVQEAVDAAPEGSVIQIGAGAYRERVVIAKNHLTLIGQSAESVVLTHSGCANDLDADGNKKGSFLSYTLLITGEHVTIDSLTVRNDAGDGREVGQAVAVYAAGDRCVFRNARMIAHQDTLYCGPVNEQVARDALPRVLPVGTTVLNLGDSPETYGRLYFESCLIRGDVDFIFGSYRCFFERCTLYMNARGGYYTAANTPKSSPYGFVFRACLLTGECAAGAGALGRPWRASAATLFMGCEMDECVSPRGFVDWDENRPVTGRCGEYGTRGARADLSTRHPNQARLTAREAANVTVSAVLDGWNPQGEGREVG